MEKKYNHSVSESYLIDRWQKKKTYSFEQNPGPPFNIDTPPPTVSGSLHIGHLFSYTQTDFSARYKRMSGYSVFYPFGFDDNGLPTERFVEKKTKVRAHEIGRSPFIQLCLDQTQEMEKQFTDLWQRMGLSVDWNYWYSTISRETRRISQLSFLKLYKAGHIYQKDEPAIYCPTCRTTVAQAELDSTEIPSSFNDIIFKTKNGSDLIVSTTRPELLYSTSALLYHPDDQRYQHLKGEKAVVPIYGHEVPIYEDENVDQEKGTGLVMVSTFGDQTDIYWYKKHNLPLRLSLGRNGKLVSETGILSGLKVAAARERILQELNTQGLIKNQKEIIHAVNVHERCKNAIEYIVLTQWFVNILDHKQTFIELADKIDWYPAFMKSRYIDWVENVKWDWCISRQRFYGIPFPVWYCKNCNEILLPNEKNLPVDPQETAYQGTTCPSCKNNQIVPEMDVMDTWNTSSLTPYICYNLLYHCKDPFTQDALNFIPMGMRPQAHDIIRTWAFYTIIKCWMHSKSIPWKQIVISGHVLSNEKEKLSKSKGSNRLDPDNLLQTYSADAIRYWTASGSLGHDITFSEAQLKIGQKLVTKLWNAFRFAEPHIQTIEPQKTPPYFGIINEWILDQASATFETYQAYFEKHEFNLALQAVEQFFWTIFCDSYLELIKHQLFNPHEYTKQEMSATQWTLSTVGLRILQLYAPYLPYVTETIYDALYKQMIGIDSIHQTKFNNIQTHYHFEHANKIMKDIQAIVSDVRKVKTNEHLSLKTPLEVLTIACTARLAKELKHHEQLLKGVTQAKDIFYSDPDKSKTELTKKDGQWHATVVVE